MAPATIFSRVQRANQQSDSNESPESNNENDSENSVDSVDKISNDEVFDKINSEVKKGTSIRQASEKLAEKLNKKPDTILKTFQREKERRKPKQYNIVETECFGNMEGIAHKREILI